MGMTVAGRERETVKLVNGGASKRVLRQRSLSIQIEGLGRRGKVALKEGNSA